MTNEEAKGIIIEDRDSLKANPMIKVEDCLYEAFEVAIKVLEQESILDKIRNEIEQTVSRYSISRESGCMGQVEWSDRLIKESEVLQIIDKYEADKEGD